jgi:endo-1,4-beta-xylanase
MKKDLKTFCYKNIRTFIFFIFLILLVSCSNKQTLKEAYAGKFLIGVAVSEKQMLGGDSIANAMVAENFNSITSENALKWDNVHPLPGKYDYWKSDSFVSYGTRHHMFLIGHTLVWHFQTPDWVFQDKAGKPVSRDTLLKRMKDHIFTVVGRYKVKVNGWDVVNEAIGEDGELRNSLWRKIIGDDYIEKAYEYTREADPGTELYYNDCNIEFPSRKQMAGAVKLVQSLQSKGFKIAGVGIQAHWGLNYPSLEEIDSAIVIYSKLGVKVMFTELDISVLPQPSFEAGITDRFKYKKEMDPFINGLPDSMQTKLANRYADIFRVFLKHKDVISRVTLWGLYDSQSWLNYWPIPGRTNYPNLFDRNYKPKPAFFSVLKCAE